MSIGLSHTLDNGFLKMGNDGVTNGLSFYSASTGGTDFKIYRTSNIAYLTRGSDPGYGIRINYDGRVAIGSHPISGNNTKFGSLFCVYAKEMSAINSWTSHSFDYGDAVKSVVYRPLSVTFAGWNNNDKTFWVLGDGSIYSCGAYITSDFSTKENIAEITNPLDRVLKLRGITFDSKFSGKEDIVVAENQKNSDNFNLETTEAILDDNAVSPAIAKQINAEKNRKRIGVIAQEVEAVVPEAVRTTHTGMKAVAYSELVGLLIEAIKEQQTQIEELKTCVFSSKLRSESSAEETASASMIDAITGCQLYQNAPNPFTVNTEIKYYLPAEIVKANLYFYDMQGKQIKNIPVADRGEGTIQIQGSELSAGMYIYTLIADNKVVDTKRMILTE